MTCFAYGTKIKTNRGDVRIEELQPGDKVLTRDNGYQPLRRISECALTARQQLVTIPADMAQDQTLASLVVFGRNILDRLQSGLIYDA